MARFKIGDRVKYRTWDSRSSSVVDKHGEIVDMRPADHIVMIPGSYTVVWDEDAPLSTPYNQLDADNEWELIMNATNSFKYTVPPDVNCKSNLPPGFSVKQDTHRPYSVGCDHKWVDVGFNHSKIVCFSCNKEKE